MKVVKLEQNYRSTSTILNAANAVIRNNAQRRGKTLWSAKGDGEKLFLNAFEHDEEEAKEIVEEIEFNRLSKGITWKDQAILFRTNQQSRVIEMELRKQQVKYNLIGGQSFFDRREIRDFLAYLKTFMNPHDDVSLLRIANTPSRGLSNLTMERLLAASQERGCSVFAAMRHSDVLESFRKAAQNSIMAFVELVEGLREELESEELMEDPAGLQNWAIRFLAEIDYLNEIRRTEKTEEAAENKVRNLTDFMSTMDGDRMSWSLSKRLEKFLEDITLDQDLKDDKEQTGDLVTLITMHASKGLEFPHVFIVGAEDGLLPHSRSKVEGTTDEERRLFYVAITRAQKTLTISHCEARRKFGEMIGCHPSPFLKEIPEELVEDAEAKGKEPVEAGEGTDLFAAMRAALE